MVMRKDKKLNISAAARKLADDRNIDYSKLVGTGKDGQITATDINNVIAAEKDAPAPAGAPLEGEVMEGEVWGSGDGSQVKMGKSNLIMHCGANLVEYAALDTFPVPANVGKRSVHIPHAALVENTLGALRDEGYKIVQQAHSVTKEGARYFGMLQVSKPNIVSDEFATIVGMRNAYDGSVSMGFVMGMQLFVCDNLAFHGDVEFSTRHDRNILNIDLLITAAAKRLETVHADMTKRADLYKARELEHKEADHLMIDMLRNGVYNPSRIERVRQEWDNPSHEDFTDQNLWRMHNAVTEALKPTSEAEQGALPRIALQTNRLHRVFDGYCERMAA